MGSPILGSRTKPRRSPSRGFIVKCGSFVGMRDSLDPAAADPQRASLLQNCYPQDGTVVVGRPGFAQMGDQMASGGRVQWVGQFTKLDGLEYTVAIVGGRIFTYNWGTEAWGEVVTVANLTTASITLDDEARVYALTFANVLVISDGINTPFTWTGATGAGGLTELTAAPVFYGPPTVYYGKLFGIMAADRAAIAWSDENDPETGYGVAEQWTLGQADTAPLTALVGTNEALYVFRARSTTVIHGQVTEDFQTTGTRSGISETIGTESPFAISVAEHGIYFLDADARPHVLDIGGGVIPVWRDLRETCRTLPRASLANATATYDPNLQLVRLSVVELNGTEASLTMCYSPFTETPSAQALFRGFQPVTMGTAKDGDGAAVLLHGAADGYVYRHGTPNGTLWDDELASGTVAIQHVVKAPYLGHDVAHDKHFNRLDVTMRAGSNMTDLGVDYETPYRTSMAQTADIIGDLAFWDEAMWDEDNWSSESIEAPLRVGINGQGRWIRPRIQHQQLGEQFGLAQMQVSGTTRSNEPNTP